MAVSVRERLSHRKLKIEEGEVAGIELTLFPENKARLHVDMALLVADVQSLQILLRDLASAYRGENLPKESKVEFCFLSRTAETGRRGGTEKRRKILEESFRAFAKRP